MGLSFDLSQIGNIYSVDETEDMPQKPWKKKPEIVSKDDV